jgi:hypothetical protein
MERVGSRSPIYVALQRKLQNLEATVAPKLTTSTPIAQLTSGFQAQAASPLTLNPQVSQAQSNAPVVSLRDVQRMQQPGNLSQTNAAVDVLTRILSAAEKTMVQGKVNELVRDGRSVEQTSPQRFAANLALELSEYIGEGKPVSPQLNAVFNKLVQDGKSVFESNPQAKAVLANNLAARANNVPSALEGMPGIDRTRAAVAQLTQGLTPADRRMVENKAAELVRDGRGIEQTNPARFAANMALELSEHIGSGGALTPELNRVFQQLVRDGDSVFRSNPRALEVLNQNLAARANNLQ